MISNPILLSLKKSNHVQKITHNEAQPNTAHNISGYN